MTPLAILLVDDDEDVRTLFETSLRLRGYTVSVARSGREAISLFEQGRFDVVVTDIIMPDGDGIDVIQTVRKTRRPVRIIAVSGGGRYVNGRYCQNLAQAMGADASLAKPFRPAELIRVIEATVAADKSDVPTTPAAS